MNRSRAQVRSSDVSEQRARRRFIELDMEPDAFTLWEIVVIFVYATAILVFAVWVYTPVGHFDGVIWFFKYYFDR